MPLFFPLASPLPLRPCEMLIPYSYPSHLPQLGACGHLFHAECLRERIQRGPPGPHITFSHMRCPLCSGGGEAHGPSSSSSPASSSPAGASGSRPGWGGAARLCDLDHPELSDLMARECLFRDEVQRAARAWLYATGKHHGNPALLPGGAFEGRRGLARALSGALWRGRGKLARRVSFHPPPRDSDPHSDPLPLSLSLSLSLPAAASRPPSRPAGQPTTPCPSSASSGASTASGPTSGVRPTAGRRRRGRRPAPVREGVGEGVGPTTRGCAGDAARPSKGRTASGATGASSSSSSAASAASRGSSSASAPPTTAPPATPSRTGTNGWTARRPAEDRRLAPSGSPTRPTARSTASAARCAGTPTSSRDPCFRSLLADVSLGQGGYPG